MPSSSKVLAPIFGTLALFYAEEGASVEKGDVLAEIEAMKTFYRVESPASGVLHWRYSLGEVIGEGDWLLRED